MKQHDVWKETTKYEVAEDLPRIYSEIEKLENMSKFRIFFYGKERRRRTLKRLKEELEIKKKSLPEEPIHVQILK